MASRPAWRSLGGGHDVRRMAWTALALVALVLTAGTAWYLRDIGRAYERISGGSRIAPWSGGVVEFAEGGAGPPVLVVHGSGGGFDQGCLIAEAVLGDGWHWIAPSRMGYLRSSLPDGATFDDQARAYAELLDHLGIARVAVVAMSHGGPSALLFALLYPARVVADARFVRRRRLGRSGTVRRRCPRRRVVTVFSHDVLYWAASHGSRGA